jgi:DMSO/TMAO reductase YedYZ molybdopterin-dependent catalytic subunit
MANEVTRRDMLKGSLAAAGLGVLGVPEWALPALAQEETLVPFTDIPENFQTVPAEQVRFLDIRKIDASPTPPDQFFTTQHYGHPQVDGASFRLKVTGLVNQPKDLSIDDLRRLGETDLVAGFECSGNSGRRVQGLASNGRWTGVPLQKVLQDVGVKDNGLEVVFFGADHSTEEVEFRGRKFEVEQNYGRSISIAKATSPDPFLAWALDGQPLTVHQGFPLRLIMPGWYGAPNVKWLANIHVQQDPYLGKFQARWYRTLRGEMIGGEMKWKETAVTHMRTKSVIARVTQKGGQYNVLGFVLNDGTPLKSVEVRVDDGPWQAAKIRPNQPKYSWKLFDFAWSGATPGEHTLVSRATDVNGDVQPTAEELETKKTFLEDNSQYPRTVMIS